MLTAAGFPALLVMDKLTNLWFNEIDWNARLQPSGACSAPSQQGSELDEQPTCEDVLGIVGHISLVTLNDEIIWSPRWRSGGLKRGSPLYPSSDASHAAGKLSSHSNSQEGKGLSVATALQNYAECLERDAKGDEHQRHRDPSAVQPHSGDTGRNLEKTCCKRQRDTSTSPLSNPASSQLHDSRKTYLRQHRGTTAEIESQPE